ncbi:unnamed protein product, partial [Meganyctiphanes norvegica]
MLAVESGTEIGRPNPEIDQNKQMKYPHYINRNRSQGGGRVPKSGHYPLEYPQVNRKNSFSMLSRRVLGERKIYCREKSKEPPYWGRVRVGVKDQQGVMANQKFQSRDDLMLFCADQIPKLKTRTNPRQTQEPQQQGGQGQGGKGKGKKGKK